MLNFVLKVTFAALISLANTGGHAQQYPARPIVLIVPIAAGGWMDGFARAMAGDLERRLGRPVVVENRAGAGTTIGAAYVARAPADGYTLLLASSSTVAINISLYKNLPYDPVKDFTPISLVTENPFLVVVHPSLNVNSLKELVDLAKRNPGELNYASAGLGSEHHVFAELLKKQTGINIHHVPYKGGNSANADLLAGRVQIMFGNVDQLMPFMKDGRLKPLAVAVNSRVDVLPDVPTLTELGIPGFETSPWICVLGPANLPAPIVDKLNKAIVEFTASPAITRFTTGMSVRIRSSSPAELGDYIRSEISRWSSVVKESGASLD